METNLQKKVETSMSFSDMRAMAETLLKSGFLPSAIRTPEQALTIMLTGKELGLGFMESLRSINVIKGRPCMSAQLLLGLCYKTKEVEKAAAEEETDKQCVFVLKRKGSPEYRSVFTLEDARKMDLLGKDNWKKQPTTMLKWRAISAACRVVFPDAISGVYTPEEIADDVTLTNGHGEPEVAEVHVDSTEKIEHKQDIPDDQLGNVTLDFGKYKGMRLSQVIGQQTDTGKAVGRDYLEWMAGDPNFKRKEVQALVNRFLDIVTKDDEINYA